MDKFSVKGRGDQRSILPAQVFIVDHHLDKIPDSLQIISIGGDVKVGQPLEKSLGKVRVDQHIQENILHAAEVPGHIEDADAGDPVGDEGVVRFIKELSGFFAKPGKPAGFIRVGPGQLFDFFQGGCFHGVGGGKSVKRSRWFIPGHSPFIHNGLSIQADSLPTLGDIHAEVQGIHVQGL